MTPEEIKEIQKKVTQEAVMGLAVYLDNWTRSQRQPTRDLVNMVHSLKKDGSESCDQVCYLLGSVLDWFNYGN